MGRARNTRPIRAQRRVVCTLAATTDSRPPFRVLLKRPVSLLSLAPDSVVLFFAGAFAGAVGKTIVAPLDRVKILLQVRGGLQRGAVRDAAIKGGLLRSLLAILHEEGIFGFWKGNLPQLLRVVPYSAVQLASYELLKRKLRNQEGELSVVQRLLAGAAAGVCSTFVCSPLVDLGEKCLIVEVTTVVAACQALFAEAGVFAFYRGLKPTVLGIAPYMALELAAYDLLSQSTPSFARGVAAALIATSCCYPLDTIRRVGQLAGPDRVSYRQITRRVLEQDGFGGLYRGFIPNAIKNLPNKGIRLSTFDAVKKLLIASRVAFAQQAAYYKKWQESQRSFD